MKLKNFILGLFVCLSSSVFAANQHFHPQANSNENKATEQKLKSPGYCEIEIVNNSFSNAIVYGVFDDGVPLQPFTVYSFGPRQYIDLFYNGYCHSGMNIYIDSASGYNIYAAYTPVHYTINIYPFLKDQLKAEAKAK